MTNRQITGVLLDVNAGTAELLTIPDTLEDLYKHLNCSCIDIVTRRIGSRLFTIVCDDEGLLKAAPRISAFTAGGDVALVGNLLIVSYDPDSPELESLSLDDAAYVLKHARRIPGTPWPILFPIL